MHILLVEDDEIVAKNLVQMFKRQIWASSVAGSITEALELLEADAYDVAVVDWMLPDGCGLEILTKRAELQLSLPIMMLTAKAQLDDKLAGLAAGADDYLPKPFSQAELIARIKALARRSGQIQAETIKVGDLVLNLNTRTVTRANKLISLAPREYMLLEYLALHQGEVIDRLALLHHVWGDGVSEFSNTVDVHVRYLRKKIDEPFDRPLIQTIKQKGYVLCDNFQPSID